MKAKIMMLSCVSLLGLTAAASAAPSQTWTGFYVGISGGYADYTNRHQDESYDWYGATNQFRNSGWTYGGQIGYNSQDRNTAWGLELDFYGADLDRDINYDGNDVQIVSEVEWLASLRKRKGFAFGDTFFYSTFGIAAGEFDGSWTEDGDVSDTWSDLGETRYGAVWGFGVERQIGGNWSLRTQFTGTRFFQGDLFVNGDDETIQLDDTVFAGTFGVNYLFGGNGGTSKFVTGTPYSFAGFFVGIGLGAHQSTVQLSDLDYDDYGGTYDILSEGAVASVQAGYNTQINGFVYGIEGDLRWYDGDRTTSEEGAAPFNNAGMNWGGNVKLKAGVAADDLLMYILAGYAFGEYDLLRDDGDIWDLGGSRSGFVVGTGLEQAITPNLTARLEATYTGLDGVTEVSPTDAEPFRGAAQDIAVMAGLNYYLGDRGAMGTGGLAPVNWQGFYAGLDGVFAYHMGQVFDRPYDDFGGTYAVPSFGAGIGGHAGYDWQDDTFVYGVIADFSFLNNDETDSVPNYRAIESSLNFLSTLRGRAGVATGQGLIFATAGVAYADIELNYDYLPAPDDDSFHFDNDRFGWTAGLGVEKMMSDSSSFKFEVLYTSFAKENANDSSGDVCDDVYGTELCTMEGYDDTITASVGYSWRWGK